MAYRLNMANANVRRHLSELEMWRTEGMVEQGVTHVQIVDAFGVHQTVITKPWSRFQQYGTPVRRYCDGKERATPASEDTFLLI